jgi:hypothetical protein
MILFKSSGATYKRVVDQSAHAFRGRPADVLDDKFVLLSKNRHDCGLPEKQVQYVAKLAAVRRAEGEELDRLFPGVDAASRWRYEAELYWVRPLSKPFDLSNVPELDAEHYQTVQGFAKLRDEDAMALFRYLATTNPGVVLDFANNAARPTT